MAEHYNTALIIAAGMSAVAALLHVGIVLGGPSWYRFFGAGERFASACAAGRIFPTVVTLGIASILGIWSACALAGAGVIAAPPLIKAALVAITTIYLLRGLAIVPMLLFARPKATPFLIWSSLICTGYGVMHLVGVTQVWNAL